MNTEDRKTYNKKYYAEKKADIKIKLCALEECALCGRKVKHQFMNRHQATGICKRNRDNHFIGDIINMKAEIENLKAKIIENNNKKDDILPEA